MYHALNRKRNGIVSAGKSPSGKKEQEAWAKTTDRVHPNADRISPLSHKTIAKVALLLWHCYSGGIRVDRENCLLVTEKFGSAIQLASLLTQVPLFCEEPVNRSHCGACRICVNNVLPMR